MMELAIVIAIAIVCAIFFRLQDDLPKAYRGRGCMGRDWRRSFPDAAKQDIRRFLTVFTEAFAFRESNRLRFRPQDRLMDVYRALYPHRWMPDQLEHVQLVQGLEDEFKREFPEELLREDATLGMIFTTMMGDANTNLEPISGSQ
jgi:propanediol dehydratase small subunit